MTTLMGYVAMSAKDALKGKEPRSLKDAGTWRDAFVQGGGGGLIGDYLLGEYNTFGRGLTKSLAGPTFSTLDDLAQLVAAARDGDKLASKSLNTLIKNVPFGNLFYLRPAINYMFLYQLQDAASPGYLRRSERRAEKKMNQEFFIKPSSVVR